MDNVCLTQFNLVLGKRSSGSNLRSPQTHTPSAIVGICITTYGHTDIFYISIYFISKCLKITKLLYNTVLQRKNKRKIQDDTNTFGLFPIKDI